MASTHHSNHGGALTLSPTPANTLSDFIIPEEENGFHLHRKLPFQLQTLEYLYEDDKNPTRSRLEDYASALGLTYEQVRRWYVDRRRKDKPIGGRARSVGSRAEQVGGPAREGNGPAGRTAKGKSGTKKKLLSSLEIREDGCDELRRPTLVQDMLYSPEYIFQKIFRKDGPPLGVEFDSLPSTAFHGRIGVSDSRCSDLASQDEQRALKRRKVLKATIPNSEREHQTKAPMKHGMGKGLMSAWQLANSNASCVDNARPSKKRKAFPPKTNGPAKRHGIGKGFMMMVRPEITPNSEKIRNRRPPRRKPVARRRPVNKLMEKKKLPLRKRKVDSSHIEKQKAPREICKLALDLTSNEASVRSLTALEDDEELELREFHAEQNPLACCTHFATSGSHGCTLCKGLLPKFPPDSVKMVKPLTMHPWDSSLELEKKLFKVFHFLYTSAVTFDLCPFTIDEFAKAFIVKESSLLGKLHVCLLELLLSDVDKELSKELSIRSNKNGMFLNLLHMAERHRSVVNFWKTSLNPLTWPEIFRQVMVAAGFGLRDGVQKKRCPNKVEEHMAKYGLRAGTLKGELFTILMEKGNAGMKVAELAKSTQVLDLKLEKTNAELEDSICSILASDITLFEKIASSTYRLRSLMKKDDDCLSDNEDCGSIDESRDSGVVSVINSECDSGNSGSRRETGHHYCKDNTSSCCTEIDESHPGESWLLGLMDGEYSALSVEEKLNALLALLDLLSAGSIIRMKDPLTTVAECIPRVYQHGSGGKIKRSTVSQPSLPGSSCSDLRETYGVEKGHLSVEVCPVDSSVASSMFHEKEPSPRNEKNSIGTGVKDYPHLMQSIFLGFDRRYNRYWLFLGPCEADDPGHARVYFESSEDGHWQVIESEEALCGFVATLNSKGRREAVLLASLGKRVTFLLEGMLSRVVVDADVALSSQSDVSEIDRVNEDSPSPTSGVDNNLSLVENSDHSVILSGAPVPGADKKVEGQNQKYARLQAYDLWIWSSFYLVLNAVKRGNKSYVESLTRCRGCHDLYWRDERHCKTCHTTFELDFDLEEKYAIHVALCQSSQDADICPAHKILPSELQALKAALHAIELVMPEDALIGAWRKSAHKLWVGRLRRTSSLQELLQVLADFVGAINVNWLSQFNVDDHCDLVLENSVMCSQDMPRTLSAVALWLTKLDGMVASQLEVVEV